MSELFNILSNNDDKQKMLTEEKWQAYLEGKLSAEEAHDLEQLLSDEGMESDAVEGLKELDIQSTKASVQKLNKNLSQQLSKKKRKRNDFYKNNQWTWISVVLLLTLVILAYLVIHFTLLK